MKDAPGGQDRDRPRRTNPLAVRMRDAIVPFFLKKAASDTTNRWIYDCHVDWHAPTPTAAPAAPRP
jgi:hypothetical protein